MDRMYWNQNKICDGFIPPKICRWFPFIFLLHEHRCDLWNESCCMHINSFKWFNWYERCLVRIRQIDKVMGSVDFFFLVREDSRSWLSYLCIWMYKVCVVENLQWFQTRVVVFFIAISFITILKICDKRKQLKIVYLFLIFFCHSVKYWLAVVFI